MADHIDHTAECLRGMIQKGKDVYGNLMNTDFPFEGMAIFLFEDLAARGFVMGPRIDWVKEKEKWPSLTPTTPSTAL